MCFNHGSTGDASTKAETAPSMSSSSPPLFLVGGVSPLGACICTLVQAAHAVYCILVGSRNGLIRGICPLGGLHDFLMLPGVDTPRQCHPLVSAMMRECRAPINGCNVAGLNNIVSDADPRKCCWISLHMSTRAWSSSRRPHSESTGSRIDCRTSQPSLTSDNR